jgi:hypothetical protein
MLSTFQIAKAAMNVRMPLSSVRVTALRAGRSLGSCLSRMALRPTEERRMHAKATWW